MERCSLSGEMAGSTGRHSQCALDSRRRYHREAFLRRMTETEARVLLRNWAGDGLESWIAAQPWRPTPDGWEMLPDFQGWRFVVEQAPSRLRLRSLLPEAAAPAEWLVGHG